MIKKKTVARGVALLLSSLPLAAMADWAQTLNDLGKDIRTGMYLLAGTIALGTMVWSGIQWMISRSNGDHQYSFLDYMKQAGVVLAVGGAVALGAAAWQVFGSGNPT
ncbi:type IV secretion system protein VirB2 [Pseudomonas chlororaphis]|uniref:type IV secretion system protein VirB2 n=1 Tax=Pseudomonas chlororaphis TaxID=587753 RepID=UPI002D782878|nr:type IV secretion system protein VirB2 [Pseudomonas chlororaphis]